MKQADKFLITIVLGVILLVITAFTIVMLRPQPQYREDLSAEAAVYNYLLALQKEDYVRALGLISQEVPHRPEDASEMEFDVKQDEWLFERYGNPAVTIAGSRISGEAATVTLNETHSDGPFLGGINSEEITMRLKKDADGWKLIDGEAYWAEDWGDDKDRRLEP